MDPRAERPVPFHRRGRQADEYLRAFTELWTKDAPAFEGEFVRFRDIGFMPKPLQAPRPPIWVGGNSPGAFRRVAELGDGWHAMSRSPEQFREELARVREAALRAGRDPAALAISLRFSLGEELLAKGPQAIVDLLAAYKRAGLQHVLVEFRREDHRRMLEILDLVAAKVCPAVEAA